MPPDGVPRAIPAAVLMAACAAIFLSIWYCR